MQGRHCRRGEPARALRKDPNLGASSSLCKRPGFFLAPQAIGAVGKWESWFWISTFPPPIRKFLPLFFSFQFLGIGFRPSVAARAGGSRHRSAQRLYSAHPGGAGLGVSRHARADGIEPDRFAGSWYVHIRSGSRPSNQKAYCEQVWGSLFFRTGGWTGGSPPHSKTPLLAPRTRGHRSSRRPQCLLPEFMKKDRFTAKARPGDCG